MNNVVDFPDQGLPLYEVRTTYKGGLSAINDNHTVTHTMQEVIKAMVEYYNRFCIYKTLEERVWLEITIKELKALSKFLYENNNKRMD